MLDTPEDTASVVREALGHDGPVVVDVRTSLEHLSTFSTLTSLAATAARSEQREHVSSPRPSPKRERGKPEHLLEQPARHDTA